jgi:cholesterol transport system auxiliary component
MRNERGIAMDRRLLLVLGSASVALSACSLGNVFGPPEAPQLYVLKPAMPVPDPGPKVPWALAIDLPEAPQNLDSDRIAISRSANTQDYFANAAWQEQLPSIIQGNLVSAFEASGRIDQVVRDTEGIRTDYLLKIDIRDFEARYDQPDAAPAAVVGLEAILVDRKERNLAARISVKKESAATQNSVEASVEAMDRALGAALADIVRWTMAALPQALPSRGKAR